MTLPEGFLVSDLDLTEEQAARVIESWKLAVMTGVPLILPQGMRYVSLGQYQPVGETVELRSSYDWVPWLGVATSLLAIALSLAAIVLTLITLSA